MKALKDVLMERDGITADEADAKINEAQKAMMQYIEDGDDEGAYDVCSEYFGLEPDYLMDVMPI